MEAAVVDQLSSIMGAEGVSVEAVAEQLSSIMVVEEDTEEVVVAVAEP